MDTASLSQTNKLLHHEKKTMARRETFLKITNQSTDGLYNDKCQLYPFSFLFFLGTSSFSYLCGRNTPKVIPHSPHSFQCCRRRNRDKLPRTIAKLADSVNAESTMQLSDLGFVVVHSHVSVLQVKFIVLGSL